MIPIVLAFARRIWVRERHARVRRSTSTRARGFSAWSRRSSRSRSRWSASAKRSASRRRCSPSASPTRSPVAFRLRSPCVASQARSRPTDTAGSSRRSTRFTQSAQRTAEGAENRLSQLLRARSFTRRRGAFRRDTVRSPRPAEARSPAQRSLRRTLKKPSGVVDGEVRCRVASTSTRKAVLRASANLRASA